MSQRSHVLQLTGLLCFLFTRPNEALNCATMKRNGAHRRFKSILMRPAVDLLAGTDALHAAAQAVVGPDFAHLFHLLPNDGITAEAVMVAADLAPGTSPMLGSAVAAPEAQEAMDVAFDAAGRDLLIFLAATSAVTFLFEE